MPKTLKEIEKIQGEKAMILISDYPLYAHTSGITYYEAIKIAMVLYPNQKEWDEIINDMQG